MTLLDVKNLHTHFYSRGAHNEVRVAKALNGVSLHIEPGEILGIVGETGAGKSLTAASVMGLLSHSAKIIEGSICFDGQNLLELNYQALNKLRGKDIGLIVQSPITSLDPLATVGTQLVRVQRAHSDVSKKEALVRAREMLDLVGIPDPDARMRAWPHELSGGMAQRVVIAMALINAPKLLIADEPTTGLDVTVQAQILDLLREMVLSRGQGAMLVTHDLGVVAHYCDRVAVMFSGVIVEQGPTEFVFAAPAHPYTQDLIDCVPDGEASERTVPRPSRPPDLYNLPSGCLFRERCQYALPACATAPHNNALGHGRDVLCHFPLSSEADAHATG